VAVELTNAGLLKSIKKIQTDMKIDARPVRLENIHFTMLFLGEITEDQAQRVQDTLDSIEFSPFDVDFTGVGAFPKPRFPQIVWIGTDKNGGEKLSNLAKNAEGVLSPLGFKSDKPFKPHITIFRIKNRNEDISKDLARFENVVFGSQKITEIKFKKSDLTPEGPIYSDLQVVKAV
jgi:2'-5' RNA ligase